MVFPPSPRLKAGLGLIFLFALSSHLRLFRGEVRIYPRYDTTLIERNETHYAGLRQMLSPGETIGYMSNVEFGNTFANLTRYFLAQYALAPTLIDRNMVYPIVMGEFGEPTAQMFFRTNSGWTVITNLSNGVFLFRTNIK